MNAHTHRTLHDVIVETCTRGNQIERHVVPAGTTGVIEYEGIIGGAPCVMFRGSGMEANLIGQRTLEVERIHEC